MSTTTHQRIFDSVLLLRHWCPPLFRAALRLRFLLQNAGLGRPFWSWFLAVQFCLRWLSGRWMFGHVDQVIRMSPSQLYVAGWCVSLVGKTTAEIEVTLGGRCLARFTPRRAHDLVFPSIAGMLLRSNRIRGFSELIDIPAEAGQRSAAGLALRMIKGKKVVEIAGVPVPQFELPRPRFLKTISKTTVTYGGQPYPCHSVSLDLTQPVLPPRGTSFTRYDQRSERVSVRKVLVLKMDHIGDFMLAVPAVKALAQMFPSAKLTMIVGPWNVEVARKVFPSFEILAFELFQKESRSGVRHSFFAQRDLGRRLRSREFDLAIDLRRPPESRHLLYESRSKISVAFTHPTCADRLDLEIPLHVNGDDVPLVNDKPHMAAQILSLVEALDCERARAGSLGDHVHSAFNRAWQPHEPLQVFIHNGAGNEIKRYPWERHVELIERLRDIGNAEIELVGSDGDHDTNAKILGSLRHTSGVSYSGPCQSVLELMVRLHRAHVVIGNDSGPCHIAAFLGIPTLTVFANSVAASEWMPLGRHAIAVQTASPCGPCYRTEPMSCPFDVFCIRHIDPAALLEALKTLVKTAYGRELGEVAGRGA